MTLASAVAVAAIVLVLTLLLLMRPATSSGPTSHQTSLVNVEGRSLGPLTQNAIVVPLTITAGSSQVLIRGWVNVTGCGSSYCSVHAAVSTPQNWTAAQQGHSVGFVWCENSEFGFCTPEQSVQIDPQDLSGYAGQPLDLCIWSAGNYTEQVNAIATMTWTGQG